MEVDAEEDGDVDKKLNLREELTESEKLTAYARAAKTKEIPERHGCQPEDLEAMLIAMGLGEPSRKKAPSPAGACRARRAYAAGRRRTRAWPGVAP